MSVMLSTGGISFFIFWVFLFHNWLNSQVQELADIQHQQQSHTCSHWFVRDSETDLNPSTQITGELWSIENS